MIDAVSDFLNSPRFGDVVRTLILMIGFGLSLACLKFAWLAYKGKEAWRVWGLLSYAGLVITPALSGLYRYGEPLRWLTTVTYLGGLLCGVMAFRTFYVLAPEWIRLRHERSIARGKIGARRLEEDALRAEDRVLQAQERGDSRTMFDQSNLDETRAAHDERVEQRAAEDSNREHSHGLQDDERRQVRRAEDDR